MNPLFLVLIAVAAGLGLLLLRSLSRGRDYSPRAIETRTESGPSVTSERADATFAYCPECGEEYVGGVTQCVECKVPLTDEPPSPESYDEQKLVRLVESEDVAYLSRLKSVLRAAGIYFIADRDSVGLTGGFGGIRVKEEDVERASELLQEMQRETSEFGEDFNSWTPEEEPDVLRGWEEQGGVHDVDAGASDASEGGVD